MTTNKPFHAYLSSRAPLNIVLVLCLGLYLSPGWSADNEKVDVPPPPPIPEESQYVDKPVDDPEAIEPEIRIVPKSDGRYEEYRIRGRLYKIKVTPKKGKPYYLIDSTGQGQFEHSDLEPKLTIPMWVIKEF
ncbi:MAG: DUF2782 domain-containing protein [Gammaproteobacteria bacterium]|nr:DUF2782 domain-containing protein [Gammaproteobacteria bacterium]